MKSLLSACVLLFASAFLAPESSAATTTTPSQSASSSRTAVPAPVTVAPGEQKTAHGVKVTNGNYAGDYPQYAGSTGKAKIKVVDGHTEVKTENGFKGQIDDLSAGENAIISASNNPVTVNGNGGSVSVGSGAVVTVNNTGGQGSTNITCTLPGGGSVSIPPGSSATITG